MQYEFPTLNAHTPYKCLQWHGTGCIFLGMLFYDQPEKLKAVYDPVEEYVLNTNMILITNKSKI